MDDSNTFMLDFADDQDLLAEDENDALLTLDEECKE